MQLSSVNKWAEEGVGGGGGAADGGGSPVSTLPIPGNSLNIHRYFS